MYIDTHRHMGGCISPEFVWNVVKHDQNKYALQSIDDVKKAMSFFQNETNSFYRFLDKFRILDKIDWSEELIDDSISYMCTDIINEDLHYVWLDMSINKYKSIGWSGRQAIKFIWDAFNSRIPGKVGLVLSLKYEEKDHVNEKVARLLDDCEVFDRLIGIDVVGDEAKFSKTKLVPIFKQWNRCGKMTRAHVGESGSSDNIAVAIKDLGVTNVAHGIKIIEDPELMKFAADTNVTFDMAITSNKLTGVWDTNYKHPGVTMLDNDLRCTIGSDDPIQCCTTLRKEYDIALWCGYSEMHLRAMRTTSIENSSKLYK